MAVSVIYHSRLPHIQKVADAIAKKCNVEAIDISEAHQFPETDLLFLGIGIYKGKPDDALMDYLDQLPMNKIKGAALFSVSKSGNDHLEMVVNLLEHKGIVVYPEHFTCRRQHFIFAKGHPDARDVRRALRFTDRVLASFNG